MMIFTAILAAMALGTQIEKPRFPDLLPGDGPRVEISRDVPGLELGSIDESYLRSGPRLVLRYATAPGPVLLQGVTGLGWQAEPSVMRPGNDSAGTPYRIVPGRPLATPLTFTRTLDSSAGLSGWAQVPRIMGGEDSIDSWRQDAILSRLDRQGRVIQRWFLTGCVPSAYEAMSDVMGSEEQSPVERLTVQCLRVIRDPAI